VASLSHQVDILMQRSRAVEPPRSDSELTIDRAFSLPTARTFSINGTAEINAGDSDNLIDQMIGLIATAPPPPPPGNSPGPARVIVANSSTRLDEDREARANAALDGNPATAWIAETGPQSGEWLSFELNMPVTFDHLDLQVVNDGRHSLPTRITLSAGGVEPHSGRAGASRRDRPQPGFHQHRVRPRPCAARRSGSTRISAA
jgi:hypothetical protein